MKSRDFILGYFFDVDKLLFAIEGYRRIARVASDYSNLSDILECGCSCLPGGHT